VACRNREGAPGIFETTLPEIEPTRFQAEIKARGQVGFETGNFISFDEDVLDPDLHSIDYANHLQAQAEMGDERTERTCQHQVCV
jgi:hypothetical protein